jgi:DNA-binding transcriptional LysR family regulator
VRLEVGNTREIIERVRNFTVDAGFIEGDCREPEIELFPFMDDELTVFAAADHPLARKGRLERRELEGQFWILREPGSGTREIFERQLNARGLQPTVRLELGHTEAIKNAVVRGRGIGCLSRWALQELLQNGRIRRLETPYLDLGRKFYLILNRRKYRSTILQGFITHLQSHDSVPPATHLQSRRTASN